jgi:MoxR-like ATPase
MVSGVLTASRLWANLRDNVGQAVVGGDEPLRLLTAALLVGGHVLVEDVPGVGKTLMAKAFARSLGLSFARAQGTPDLLPSDVTGSSILDGSEFRFVQGPIFNNVVLFDEINRATPRTQSALLEAMQERQVSVDGVTRLLPRPFVVLATQNPIELEGTPDGGRETGTDPPCHRPWSTNTGHVLSASCGGRLPPVPHTRGSACMR